MNIYFQFLTQNQSLAATDLIRLPALLGSEQTITGKTKMVAGGKLTNSKFSSLETLSSSLAAARFNELEVVYDVKKLKIGNNVGNIKTLNGVFYPSPTCKFWVPSSEFLETDRNGSMRKMNAWKDEECLKGLRINQKPSVFELAIEIETSDSETAVLDNFAQLLASQESSNLKIFGCCDAGTKEMLVRLETNVLMLDKIRIMAKVLPTAYPELGEKFDDLHPLMFGTKQVCSELARVLGNDARLIYSPNGSDFAVIRMNSKCDLVAARKRANDWLLPTI
jgi:hypothetical protein